MQKFLLTTAILLTFLLTAPCLFADQAPSLLRPSEITVNSGYFRGRAKHNPDYQGVPFSVQILYRANTLLNLDDIKGDFLLGFEPFVDLLTEYKTGVTVGAGLTAKYVHPLTEDLSAYVEIASGPSYLSVETIEQGEDGFNFLNQGGAGLRYAISAERSIDLGYRFRHLSHADIRGKPNGGIDTQAVIVGYTFHF